MICFGFTVTKYYFFKSRIALSRAHSANAADPTKLLLTKQTPAETYG